MDQNKLFFQLTGGRKIKTASCSCKAGIVGQCKHTAALIIFINEFNDPSKTNERQSWGIPKVKEGYSKGKRLSEMFPREVKNDIVPRLKKECIMESFPDISCPLYAAVKAQRETKDTNACQMVITDMIETICNQELHEVISTIYGNTMSLENYSSYESSIQGGKIFLKRITYAPSPSMKPYYDQFVILSLSDMIGYAKSTVKQALCPIWKSIRKCRLSSSMCHQIVTRTGNFDELAGNIIKNSFHGNSATRYGSQMERAAKAWFSYKNQTPLLDCGVIISAEFPWLCCSPDSLYYFNNKITVLEIKCPYTRKGQKIKDGNISLVPYIKHDGNRFFLKNTNAYYTQVQISMLVTKTDQCTFLVYSSKDNLIVTVTRDESFLSEYIPKLESFYFNYLLPVLCSQ